MDNLTHTLVGVLVGEATARAAPATAGGLPAPARRTAILALMVVGSNLPDADLVTTFFNGDRLNYLLEHRGYTHTVVGAVAAAVLLFALAVLVLRARRLAPSRADYGTLAATALIGPLLHVAMDLTNSYGVHPLWPFYNGWMYGDSVFILEPMLWATAAPLIFVLKTRSARGLLALLLAAGIALAFGSGLVPRGLAIALGLLTLLMLAVGRLLRAGPAVLASLAMWVAVTATFVAAGRVAAACATSEATRSFPHEVLLDHVLTPMPADPLCWELLLIERDGERYTVRRAMLSIMPRVMPVASCRNRALEAPTIVPLEAVAAAAHPAVQWHGEFAMSREALKELVAGDCRAAALMRFARAPWAARPAAQWLIGDLRFDRGPRLGFASLALDGGSRECGRYLAPWLPPRRDLLD
jgi:inner membrane protein